MKILVFCPYIEELQLKFYTNQLDNNSIYVPTLLDILNECGYYNKITFKTKLCTINIG